MIIKDLIDLKTINKRNLIRADVTKKIAVFTLVSVFFATAGLITGVLISPKVRKRFNEVKKEVIDVGSNVKEDILEGYKEFAKDIHESATDVTEDIKNKKR